MKKWSMFLAAAACACVLASPLQAAERKKVNISFPTAATTGALYPLGAGIANLWNTKLGYVNARVQASNGGIQNLNLLKAGNAQVSFAVSSITYEALNGERGFKDRAYKDVRVLAGLYYNPNQVVARTDSGVASLADFKGKSSRRARRAVRPKWNPASTSPKRGSSIPATSKPISWASPNPST